MNMHTSTPRVALLLLLGACGAACGRDRKTEPMTQSSSAQLSIDEAELLRRLQEAEGTGRLQDLEIEHWIGGGLPPPHHRSDQLRFALIDGKPTIELNVETIDQKRPGLAMIEYRAPLGADELRAIATLIRTTGVFARHFAEEQEPQVADILRTEIELASVDSSKSVKRTYYESPPSDLRALTARVKQISDRLRAEGQKRYLDSAGKELP